MKSITWLVFAALGTGMSLGRVWFIPKSDDKSTKSSLKEVWRSDELGRKSKKQLTEYLSAYGYEATQSELQDQSNTLDEQVKDFQYSAGLEMTGYFDKPTLKLINTERCGVKDSNPHHQRMKFEEQKTSGRTGRHRRFNHQGTTWKNACNLRWQYVHQPSARNGHIGEEDMRQALRKVMKMWEDTTNIQFIEDRRVFTPGSHDEPEVLIRFASDTLNKHHTMDSRGFDDEELAHAFYPQNQRGIAGDIHINDDEDFTLRKRGDNKYDLNWVIAHELGHVLGLDHSRQHGALMYPYYTGYLENMRLPYDDRAGIQTLYGGKIKDYCSRPKYLVCPSSKMTAIWSHSTNTLIAATTDHKLYHLKKDGGGLADEGVVDKHKYFDVRGIIQAAYQTNFGKEGGPVFTIVFTLEGYYVYDKNHYVSGPYSYNGGNDAKTKVELCTITNVNDRRPLRLNFPPFVVSIDAVMKWKRDNKVYFFTGGSLYWIFDEKKQKFDCGYPRLMKSMWKGVPHNVDAVYSGKGKTVFVKGNDLFQFDDQLLRVKERKNVQSELLRCQQ